jgi:hypothetical protein
VPDEFLDRLPGELQMPDRPSDPKRFLYFSEDRALYRVMHNPNCHGTKEDWWCTSFYTFSVEKDETMEVRLREQAARTLLFTRGASQARTVADLDPDQRADYDIYLAGDHPYLWTSDMFTALADVPSGGATIPPREYERHTALYRAMQGGVTLIENRSCSRGCASARSKAGPLTAPIDDRLVVAPQRPAGDSGKAHAKSDEPPPTSTN